MSGFLNPTVLILFSIVLPIFGDREADHVILKGGCGGAIVGLLVVGAVALVCKAIEHFSGESDSGSPSSVLPPSLTYVCANGHRTAFTTSSCETCGVYLSFQEEESCVGESPRDLDLDGFGGM